MPHTDIRSLFLALVLAAVAAAGQAAETVALQPIKVTGEQPSSLETPPAALKTEVTTEELKSINAPTVSETLKYQPSLTVRHLFPGDNGAEVALRGTATGQTTRVLILGDGLLLSNFLGASWRSAPRWGMMQPEELESIEVIYGPYAAEYSGHTMGGAVIMHSAMPDDFQAQFGAGAFLQTFDLYGTDDSYFGHKLHASVGDKIGRWSYYLGASRLKNNRQPIMFGITRGPGGAPVGNPVTGAHAYPGGGYVYNSTGGAEMADDHLKLKLGYDITDDLQARLTLAYVDETSNRLQPEPYLRDAAGQPVRDGTVDIDGKSYAVHTNGLSISEARNVTYGLTLEGALGNGWDIEAAASVYNVLEDASRSSGTWGSGNYASAVANGPGSLGKDQGTGWTYFNLKFGHSHDLGWLGQRLLFGYHFDRYVLDRASYATSNWREASITRLLGDSEGKTSTHALFIENEWWLGDAWTLVLGLRQEWWRAFDGSLARDAGGTRLYAEFPERSESHLSPKATLSFAPDDDWLVRLSLGKAYRFPTVMELYQGQITNQGTFSAAFDPNLKAEEAFARNLMIRRFFDQATVTLSLWQQDVENTIFTQRNVFTGVRSNQNIGRVRLRGIDLVATTRDLWVDGLDLNFSVSYTDAEIRQNNAVPASEGNQFPGAFEWRAKLFANYRVTDCLRVGGGVRYASDPYESLYNRAGEDADAFGYVSDYLVLDARASYDLGRGFTLAAGVDNITDERYFSYHPYPGRTFFTELTWTY